MTKKLKRSSCGTARRRHGATAKLNDLFQLSIVVLISLAALLNFGCQPNKEILKSVPPPPTPMSTVESKKTSFEEDLRDMRTANFDNIYAFRRKDGGTFDKDDKKYLRDNTPLETNRWTSTDEGKAYLAGSGFGFSPENMDALRKRFIVEDYSKPEIKEANQNANKVADKAEKPQANK